VLLGSERSNVANDGTIMSDGYQLQVATDLPSTQALRTNGQDYDSIQLQRAHSDRR
jgi:hypothetical protein